jgi:hypothetical protein
MDEVLGERGGSRSFAGETRRTAAEEPGALWLGAPPGRGSSISEGAGRFRERAHSEERESSPPRLTMCGWAVSDAG